MRNSILILVLAAFTMVALGLVFNASAECQGCTQEGDWSQSASNFISGNPVSEEAPLWGPKATRKTSSQFENENAGKFKASDDATGASGSVAGAAKAGIDLINISAAPSPVSSGSAVKINAVFKESNATDTSAEGNGSMITALATILDSNGKEVGTVSLSQTSEHEYSGVWNAVVAAGEYTVSVAASSPQATGTFENALKIDVVEATADNSGTTTSSAPVVTD